MVGDTNTALPLGLGRAFERSRATNLVAAAVALLLVSIDMLVAGSAPYGQRALPAVVAILLLLALARGDVRSMGLRVRPEPSIRWWVRTLAFVALALGALLFAVYLVGRAYIGELVLPLLFDRWTMRGWVVHAILVAPLVEETIYRLALVPPLVPLIGRWATIAVSGTAFAALHWVYGRPGPDNQIAGFLLAWAYVRSGCAWFPILLHAFGNLVVFLFHLGLMEGWLRIPGLRVE